MAGGNAGHEGVSLDVAGDDGPGGNEGVLAQGDAADDGGVGANGGAALDPGAAVFVLSNNGGAGVMDIGEDHAGAAEDIVLQGDGVVNADVVLHLTVIAKDHVIADKDVLAKGAARADAGTATDMDPVPNAGARTYLSAGIDDGRGTYRIRHRGGLDNESAEGMRLTLESKGSGITDGMDNLDGVACLVKPISMTG